MYSSLRFAHGDTYDMLRETVRDFAQSEEVDLAHWHARPLWRRVKQRIWGWLDRLVVNFLDRRD